MVWLTRSTWPLPRGTPVITTMFNILGGAVIVKIERGERRTSIGNNTSGIAKNLHRR